LANIMRLYQKIGFIIKTHHMELVQKHSIFNTIANAFFLIVLNLSLMFVIGYLTLDSEANLNSRAGAILLSFFLPIFIVVKTKGLSPIVRMMRFGLGFITYAIMSIIMVGFPVAFATCLLPCLVLALAVLYYGDKLIQ